MSSQIKVEFSLVRFNDNRESPYLFYEDTNSYMNILSMSSYVIESASFVRKEMNLVSLLVFGVYRVSKKQKKVLLVKISQFASKGFSLFSLYNV